MREPQQIELFGFGLHTARKAHICWLCGKEIAVGERYWTQAGKSGGSVFKVKHHRGKCELVPEIIDQHQNELASAVFNQTARPLT